MTKKSKSLKTNKENTEKHRPTRAEAQNAVRTLLQWAGDDPDREGLLETPARVVRAFEEYFIGYTQDPRDILNKSFEDVGGYDDMVLLKDICLQSHCEHHIALFIGHAHIAYIPDKKVVGISKIARVVDVFSRRLQIQERLTTQIAEAIDITLKPKGVAVMIEAVHSCMSMRGARKSNVGTVTTRYLGDFRDNDDLKEEFLAIVRGR